MRQLREPKRSDRVEARRRGVHRSVVRRTPGWPRTTATRCREQRILDTAAGLVDRSHRDVLAVPGEDRLTWLHSLTTQHLTGLPPMTGSELLVLSPHGHVEHHAVLRRRRHDHLAGPRAGRRRGRCWTFLDADALHDCGSSRPTRPPTVAVLSLVGPQTDEALRALGVGPLAHADVVPVPPAKFATGVVPPRPDRAIRRRGPARLRRARPAGRVRRGPAGAARRGADVIAAAAAAAGRDLGVSRRCGWPRRRPRFGFETDHRTLAGRGGLDGARRYTWKRAATAARRRCPGCTTSAARRAGWCCCTSTASPPTSCPRRHTEVVKDGRAVGFVGTAVRHYELGQIALAVVRQNVKPDDGGSDCRSGRDRTAAIDPL